MFLRDTDRADVERWFVVEVWPEIAMCLNADNRSRESEKKVDGMQRVTLIRFGDKYEGLVPAGQQVGAGKFVCGVNTYSGELGYRLNLSIIRPTFIPSAPLLKR